MVLDKLPGPGRPTSLDKSRARAYCTCSRCGWGLFGHFTLIYPFSFLSPSLLETTRYRLKYYGNYYDVMTSLDVTNYWFLMKSSEII